MVGGMLKRLCPCYFSENEEFEHLCPDFLVGDAALKQINRSDGFLTGENYVEPTDEKENSIWKGTLNLVRPQPMYAVPCDVNESSEYNKSLLQPILCWAKTTKSLAEKGPVVCEKMKIHNQIYAPKYRNTKLQSPIKSNSEIVGLKRCGMFTDVYSVKTKRTVEKCQLRSVSLHDFLVREDALDRGDKWYFTKDYHIYPDVSHGVVLFTAVYFERKKILLLNVHRLENLSKKGREGFSYRTILKASILPCEKYLKCSKLSDRSSSPQIEQDFTFPLKDLTDKVLKVSVFDASLQKSYDAIGHALLSLENSVFNYPKKYRMKLYKQSKPHVTPGNLLTTLSYDLQSKEFLIVIEKAKNLKLQNDKYAKFSSYVKVSLFSYGEKVKTKKSSVVTNCRNPNYNSTFTFLVKENQVDHLSILVSVKLKSFVKDATIGHVIFGPFFVEEQKLTPWGRVFLKNEVVSHWFRMYL